MSVFLKNVWDVLSLLICKIPMESLFADDVVMVTRTELEVSERFHIWKEAMECKGLRVNLDKMKPTLVGEGERRVGNGPVRIVAKE